MIRGPAAANDSCAQRHLLVADIVRTAVNDNDTRISTNTTTLSSQDSRITALEGASSGSSAYGNGSSGALAISSSQDWTDAGGDAPANEALQFTDITIGSGQTLTLPSGTVIRRTGTFTNNGTLAVAPAQSPSSITNGPEIGSRDRGDNQTANGNWNVVGRPYDKTILRQLLDPGAVSGQMGALGTSGMPVEPVAARS